MLKAGYCKKDITPIKNYPMAGFDLRKEANVGVHDPIGCYMLVLEDGGKVCVFGSFDLLGITDELVAKIRLGICGKLPVKPDSVMLGAIHTHAAPQAVFSSFACYDADYVAYVSEQAITAALEAYNSRYSVTAEYAHTEVGNVASYRDRIREESEYAMPCDSLYLRGMENNRSILLTVYACHPTVLNEQNFLVSRDLVYGCDRRLKEVLKDTDILFFNSACGDASTRYSRRESSYREACRLGTLWADAVIESLEKAESLELSLQTKEMRLFIPPAEFFTSAQRAEILPYLEQKIADCADLQQKREYVACRSVLVREHYGEGSGCEVILSICSLGDISLCMMPFEYASVDADELKERLYCETGKRAVICCYSGGYEGYLPSGRPLDKDSGYEDMASCFRYDAKQLVANAFVQLAKAL